MGIHDAKEFVGRTCSVRWLDRTGKPVHTVSRIHDVTYVPLYGGYLVVDTDDIRLDRVLNVLVLAEDGSAEPAYAPEAELPVAA